MALVFSGPLVVGSASEWWLDRELLDWVIGRVVARTPLGLVSSKRDVITRLLRIAGTIDAEQEWSIRRAVSDILKSGAVRSVRVIHWRFMGVSWHAIASRDRYGSAGAVLEALESEARPALDVGEWQVRGQMFEQSVRRTLANAGREVSRYEWVLGPEGGPMDRAVDVLT
ncbi:MAG: hypothetical protein KJ698_12215, partial [Actinobacteria bacterium]|nr:hypothetical protein [Actinomycetota bacterium]